MPQDLFTKIRTLETTLTEKQRVLAPYFLSHLEKLPFLTTSEIARNAGVSEPTIIRFVRQLGYRGFVEFQVIARGNWIDVAHIMNGRTFKIHKGLQRRE